ncbi:MAG: GtrA family protein [Verrucomicrobia bacterium]|nr:GtrA family protein [Verrucomicrobiota bacterium]MBU1735303.1 GtrA family protein [Verrucomicrobiota bacterium]MBU1858157.1 GtrA family protein [Verrucomicrobiota bacterium]
MASIWKQFTQREASPLIQFIKYAICGGGAVTVHVIAFFLLAWLIIPALNAEDVFVKLFHLSCAPISDAIRARNAMINNALAFLLSNLAAYILNILWVFESGRRYPPVDFFLSKLGLIQHATLRACAHRTVEVALFYAVSGIAIAIGTFLMGVMINQWHFTTTVAFGAQCVIAAMINFAMRKFMIFKS